MTGVSAIIMAGEGEAGLAACRASLTGLDEIIVIGADGIQVTGPDNRLQQAVDRANHDWVLLLRDDERLGPGLLRAVESLEPVANGYSLICKEYFLGKPMRNVRWAIDCQLRLFDRRQAAISPGAGRQGVTVAGASARLDGGWIERNAGSTLDKYLANLNRGTTIAAGQQYRDGRRFSLLKMVFGPPAEFWKLYLVLGGWRDGLRGLALAGLSALYKLSVQGKLLELSRG